MKRDMDLVRDILITVEASDKLVFYQDEGENLYREFDGKYTPVQIRHHLSLLEDAKFIRYYRTGNAYQVGPNEWEEEQALSRLTWEGHEFLDAARDQNRWNQAKRTISEKGGSLTFDVLKAVLAQLARQAVGL